MSERENNGTPVYSPGPWSRGILYTALALGALLYGDLSGERPLDTMRWIVLGSVAVAAGIAIAVLQTWARNAANDEPKGD